MFDRITFNPQIMGVELHPRDAHSRFSYRGSNRPRSHLRPDIGVATRVVDWLRQNGTMRNIYVMKDYIGFPMARFLRKPFLKIESLSLLTSILVKS